MDDRGTMDRGWSQMTDRHFVLKWAHMGLGRNPRYRHIIEEQRRRLEEHIAEIEAEQEQRNAALRKIDYSHIPPLRIAARYAAGRPRATRRIRLDALLAYQFAESKVSAVQLADILRQSRPDD